MHPLLVTAAIIRRPQAVLLTQRLPKGPQGGQWEFPGGKLNAGESPEQALKRELREELDLDVEVESIFEVAYYRYDWGPVLILAYECKPLSAHIRNLEVAAHRWVNPAELHKYDILAADRPIVERLAAQSAR